MRLLAACLLVLALAGCGTSDAGRAVDVKENYFDNSGTILFEDGSEIGVEVNAGDRCPVIGMYFSDGFLSIEMGC